MRPLVFKAVSARQAVYVTSSLEVLSMLPPQMLRVASRAGGRTLQGSRSDALKLLNDCGPAKPFDGEP